MSAPAISLAEQYSSTVESHRGSNPALSLSITVHSKPACVQCTATYRSLDKLGAEYTTVDISVDEAAREEVMSLGYSQAPVVIIRDQNGDVTDHWSGMRPDKIKAVAAQQADLAAYDGPHAV